MLDEFYRSKDKEYRITQKTSDLRKLINKNIERCMKKRGVFKDTLRDISSRERHRLFGELINAQIYLLKQGMTMFETEDIINMDGETIRIPLDGTLTPPENAQRYFKLYSKEKRTFAALQEQIRQNDDETEYLESVLYALSECENEADIELIKAELSENGYVKKINTKNKRPPKINPFMEYNYSGYEILVGKNNKQNDELTTKIASKNDLWFHAKDIAGSHVILKANDADAETLEYAANLAAYYSKARNGSTVPVDYTLVKYVKKPSGAKPGMVIYTHQKTVYVTPTKPTEHNTI
jgi:predicted ribosome quality control (RQC) complex YloA/Tae2 family protein